MEGLGTVQALLWLLVVLGVLGASLLAALLLRTATAFKAAAQELRDELRTSREESRSAAKDLRDEVAGGQRTANDTLLNTLKAMGDLQRDQLEGVRTTLDARVKQLQDSNEKKLDEMRKTVDEKLQDTLEKRLSASFKQVSERLEAVHQGLGEMQVLASGVGDLKRVLSNVRVRGTWAEVQLGGILEQILTPAQFERDVAVRADSTARVEYAIRLPGRSGDAGEHVWLPIDSKFPQEDYLRLQEAAEEGNQPAVQAASDALARAVKTAAKDIHDKYVHPPSTTDFAIMFLATEGLYAEVLRYAGLTDELQQQYRVVVAGPTTLAAVLNSLRMGFQTLAIQERAAEVWQVLAAVKTEFGKFGEVLGRAKRQLDTVRNTLDDTDVRTRAMGRRLRSVEQLPEHSASMLLGLSGGIEDDELEEDEEELPV